MTSTAVQRPRAPLPIPDNASAWAHVLRAMDLDEPNGPGPLQYTCNALTRALKLRLISGEEHDRLLDELGVFLAPPLSGYDPAEVLTHAARSGGYWPDDLHANSKLDCRELRLRFIRWRAGLPIGGPLPWADAEN